MTASLAETDLPVGPASFSTRYTSDNDAIYPEHVDRSQLNTRKRRGKSA